LDTATGKEIRRFTTAKDGVSQLAFAPDGKSLAWGGHEEGTVYLGEIASGLERARFVSHSSEVLTLVFSSDAKMLISGSKDTTALVWDLTGRLTIGQEFGKALSTEAAAKPWKSLAGDDATAAYRAIQALAADPVRSIPYLRTRLHPVAPVDDKNLQRWIADLDGDQFAVREKATSALTKAGAAALHAMRKALDGKPTLETRRRLEQLIDQQEREEERAGTPEARDVLRTLANGAPGAWQTIESKSALERLARSPTGTR
jgi:hypothetical protein